jgi:hypothetical protein
MSNKSCPACGSGNTKVKDCTKTASKIVGGIAGKFTPIGSLGKDIGGLVGYKIDKHLIGKYKCKDCGHKFYP